jgi:hypothetical protein
VLLIVAIPMLLTGCAHVEPFHFCVQDSSTGEPLPDFIVYWTESWQNKGGTMPFRSRSGFLWSDGTNGVRVVGLRGAVDETCRDNSFRFSAKGYEPLDLSYIPGARTPAVGLFNTRKSPRPVCEMGSVITIDTTCHFSQFLKNKIGNGSFFTC